MKKKKILFWVGIFFLLVVSIFVISEIKNNVLCEPHLAGHTLYTCRDSLYEKLFTEKEYPDVAATIITLNAYDKNENKINEKESK